jgi:hypothetical protein
MVPKDSETLSARKLEYEMSMPVGYEPSGQPVVLMSTGVPRAIEFFTAISPALLQAE